MAAGLFLSGFNPNTDIPSLDGKVVLVTGGNNGLGLETVVQLAQHNPAKIYLAARSESKGTDAIAAVQKRVPDACPITYLPLDLASFASVKAAAEIFNAQEKRLDLLYNNAGVMMTPAELTKEGYETEFGTNHMGHALLTKLLLPTLLRTASTAPPGSVRIINLSSEGHRAAPRGGIAYDTLKTDMASYVSITRYGQSKLANIHFARALSTRYPSITSVSVHPGVVATNLVAGVGLSYPLFAPVINFLSRWMSMDVSKGAWSQLWAGTADGVANGKYYMPVGKMSPGSGDAQDEGVTEALWDWTEKELKEHGF